ncbi:MAG: Fe-S cluster assembly sulfur transfer protein SufU [Candidatus Nanopelagicales bacterium]
MQLESMYQEIILDHYRSPHRRGLREPYDVEVHHVNPTCGDEVTLRVLIRDDRIVDISHEGVGCSISQASTSVMTDLVVDRPLGEALKTGEAFRELMLSRGAVEPEDAGLEDILQDGVAFAGVSKFPARVKCALLGWMAFKDAAAQAVDGIREGQP